jgi:3-hydroxyisobutyrate dehydrogenase-like beta-hydroxyacid dehydrogenase
MSARKVGLIGFGEAGMAFATGWNGRVAFEISAYDIKTDKPELRGQKLADYAGASVAAAHSPDDLVQNVDAIFSLVTANQAGQAAKSACNSLRKNAFFFDCNSCSPGTKRDAAMLIEAAGGRYVDVAVMAPVYPKLHRAPLLISGPHATDAAQFLLDTDMNVTVVEGDVGAASTIKMIRSIMIKGIEALTAECFLASRKAGIDSVILQSLDKSYPAFHWAEKAAYNLERMMLHGHRRAAEMHEVTKTVEELGLTSEMSQATAKWQQRIGDLELDVGKDNLGERADAVLAALSDTL